MYPLLKALYREPVLFNGVIVATAAGLSAGKVIPAWIGATVAGVGAVITRRYTRPDKKLP